MIKPRNKLVRTNITKLACYLIDIHFFNEICNKTVFYRHKAVKKMLLVNFLIAIIVSNLFTLVHRFNGLLCKLVNVHSFCLLFLILYCIQSL